MAGEPTGEVFTPQKEVFETSTVIDGQGVSIRVDLDGLRRDLLREAKEQGVSEDRITGVLEKTTFKFFDGNEQISHHLADEKHREIAVGFRSWLSKKSNKTPTEIAGIESENGGEKLVFLFNTGGVVELVEKNQLPHFKLPPGAPREAKRMALVQGLDAMWRHERQHLIQFMDPEKESKMLKELKLGDVVHKISLSSFFGMTGLTLVSTTALIPDQMRAPLFLSSAIAAGVSVITAGLNLRRFQEWSGYEREAKQYHKPEHWRGQSPFQAVFEGD